MSRIPLIYRDNQCFAASGSEPAVSSLTSGGYQQNLSKCFNKRQKERGRGVTCSIASCTSGVRCNIASKSSANSNSSSSIIVKTPAADTSPASHFLVRRTLGNPMTSRGTVLSRLSEIRDTSSTVGHTVQQLSLHLSCAFLYHFICFIFCQR